LLLRRERDAHLPCLHLPFDRGKQRLVTGAPVAQQPVLPAQMVVGSGGGVGEDLRDLVEPELQFPVEQHLAQPVQVGL